MAPTTWRPPIGEVLVVVLALVVDLLLWGGARELRIGDSLPILVVPVVSVAVFAALWARWRWPVAVFSLHWTYGIAGLAVTGYEPIAGLLVALHAVARCSARRTAGLALAACAVPFGIACAVAAAERVHLETSFWASLAVQFLLYAFLTLVVWEFGRRAHVAQRRSEERERALTDDIAQAVRAQHERAAAAVQEERRRLARELHDIVGDGVTAMYLHAAGARMLVGVDDTRAAEALSLIETTGVQTMNELHRLLGLLRAVNPDDTEGFARSPMLSEDLDGLLALTRGSGVNVETVIEGQPVELDRSVDAAAYRVVQEALTNTVKYAGRGADAAMHLSWGEEVFSITVRDTRGLPVAAKTPVISSGYGLVGLTERVTLVGGRLEAGPVDGGFLVHAEFPTSNAMREVPGQKL